MNLIEMFSRYKIIKRSELKLLHENTGLCQVYNKRAFNELGINSFLKEENIRLKKQVKILK